MFVRQCSDFQPEMFKRSSEFFSLLVTKSPRSSVDYCQAVISVQSHVFTKTILQRVEYEETDEFAYFNSVVTSHSNIESVVSVAFGPCAANLVEKERFTGMLDDFNVALRYFGKLLCPSNRSV